jgi:NADH-quinone oxidoreductase subunit M
VIFGDIANDNVRTLTDINAREMTILAVLALLVLFMGLYPKPFTDVMHVSVDALLQHVSLGKLN